MRTDLFDPKFHRVLFRIPRQVRCASGDSVRSWFEVGGIGELVGGEWIVTEKTIIEEKLDMLDAAFAVGGGGAEEDIRAGEEGGAVGRALKANGGGRGVFPDAERCPRARFIEVSVDESDVECVGSRLEGLRETEERNGGAGGSEDRLIIDREAEFTDGGADGEPQLRMEGWEGSDVAVSWEENAYGGFLQAAGGLRHVAFLRRREGEREE